MTLWGADNEAAWAAAWASYDSVLASVQKSELAELDGWYLASFPPILRAREPEPFMQKQELQRLMEWKLKKGKWRPQLMKFVSNLGESEVEQASRGAFEQLKTGDLRAATEALCALKGVGPATASAVLAAYDESVPFMADEALEAIAGIIGPRKYTLPHFLTFAEQLRAKAKWLNEQRAAKEAGASEWTAQRVQLCLYAEAHDGAAAAPVNKKIKATSPAAKRKREKTATTTTTTPSAKKKEKKADEQSAEDQDRPLRRSQRKRQSPTS